MGLNPKQNLFRKTDNNPLLSDCKTAGGENTKLLCTAMHNKKSHIIATGERSLNRETTMNTNYFSINLTLQNKGNFYRDREKLFAFARFACHTSP